MRCAGVALFGVFMLASCCLAGTIAGAGVLTAIANNDGVSPLANTIILDISDTGGPVDSQFFVAASGGATEYYLTQLITNFSGTARLGYRFELGFGVGSEFATSSMFDFLDFDTPDRDPAPTSTAFLNLVHTANVISFSEGTLAQGDIATFTMSIDVPDGNDIPNSYRTDGGYTFTVRQLGAETPEPGTWRLLLLGATALIGFSRKRA